MASQASVGGELPILSPIKTAAPTRDKRPVEGHASSGDGGGDEEGCVTPKSEEHTLKPPAVCPAAARKATVARRTPPLAASATDSKKFRAMPRDLTSLTIAGTKFSPFCELCLALELVKHQNAATESLL